MLAALAFQGALLATNGVGAPWIMASFGLDQPSLARVFAWVSVSAIGAYLLARRADHVGRRRMLSWSIAIGSMAAIGAAWAARLPVFVVFDTLALAAGGAAVTCGVVWMAEASSTGERAANQALAGLAVMLGSGPCVVLMPLLAGTALSWRGLFLIAVPAVVLIPFLPPDAPPDESSRQRSSDLGRPTLFDRGYRARALVLVATTALSTTATASAESWRFVHMVNDAGLAPSSASLLLILAGLAALVGFPLGARASNRIGRVPTVAGFLVVMALSLAWSFCGPPSGFPMPWLWLASGFIVAAAAGNAITVGANTLVNELMPAALRATMFGWLNVVGSVARVATQMLVALAAPRLGAANAVGALALVGLPAAVLLITLVPETNAPGSAGSASERSQANHRRPPLVARLAVSAAVTLVGLFALEGAVRLIAPRAVMVPWQDDIQGITAPRRDVSGRFAIPDRFETTLTIHSRFRSAAPVPIEPVSGTVRIAALGDSCTFGWGAGDGESYPAVTERVLRERGGIRAEVINAGVIGTGTGEQALWYDLWVRQFKPSVVVLSVYWNDVDDDMRAALFERVDGDVRPRPLDVLDRGLSSVRRTREIAHLAPGFDWLSQHSQLLSWIRQAPTEFLVAAHAKAVGGENPAGVADADALGPEALAMFVGEIRWLRGRIDPAGRLVIVFLPSAELYDESRSGAGAVRTKSGQIVEALKQVSAESGTPLLDLRSTFASQADPARLFFARDPHPNVVGYRVIGEAVASFLRVEIAQNHTS